MQRTISRKSGLELTHPALRRFPSNDPNLQGWDSADSYIVNYVEEHLPECRNALVLNDRFGAISVALTSTRTTLFSDSYCALHAADLNRSNYPKDLDTVNQLDAISGDFDVVIVRLPKSLFFFETQLAWIAQNIKPGTPILVASMVKHLPHTAKELMEHYLGQTHVSHAWKKARLLLNVKEDRPITKTLESKGFDVFGRHYDTLANVYCRERLDPGTALLLQCIEAIGTAETVADLGCGSGVLGVEYARHFHPQLVQYFDESFDAVRSATLNHEKHAPTVKHQSQCGHSLERVSEQRYDLILNNPPFHQDQVVGDFIARAMFEDASRCLNENGRLVVVGNRHLNYHQILRRWFKRVSLIKSNAKFVVLMADNH